MRLAGLTDASCNPVKYITVVDDLEGSLISRPIFFSKLPQQYPRCCPDICQSDQSTSDHRQGKQISPVD